VEGNGRGVIYGGISEFCVKGLREITDTQDIVLVDRNWKQGLSTTMYTTNKIQQFPPIDLFIDLFEFALHVSGNKLVHLQEHFLTVYTALVQSTDVAADR